MRTACFLTGKKSQALNPLHGILISGFDCKEPNQRAPLVAQWLRIHLPMQGTRVRALVREDPTCRGATKPVCHNY
ncbi:hypothetical protein J1605_013863 [Eschrichtius robustus]|uniref:Uncharacterized protein n=1 Tax=Eschrichtius robustus TaxID=9764 RepID=A0AB34GGG3_ESCRO|nr:hypothetical protein J1605_013863 [Eschrichtius robustus]